MPTSCRASHSSGEDPLLKRRLSGDALRYAPGLVIPILVATLSTVIFARLTTPSVLGSFLLVSALVTSVGMPAGQWLQQSVLRFYSMYAAEHRLRSFLRVVLLLALVSGAVGALLIAVLLWAGLGDADLQSGYILPAALLAFFTIATAGRSSVLQASFASTRYSVLTAGFSVVKFVLPLALLPLIDPLAALLWGTTIATILNWFVLVRQTPAAAREGTVGGLRELRDIGRAMVHFGLPLSVSEIGVQVLQYSDRYAIAALLGAAAVGLYSTNYSIAEKLLILVQAPLVYAAHPPIMAFWERGERAEAEDMIQTATRWLLLLGLPLVAFTLARSELVSRFLLGEAYVSGHFVIPIIAASVLLYAACQYGHKCFELSKQTVVITGALLAAAALNVVAAITLTLAFGIIGGALATGAGYATYAVLIFVLSRRFGPLKWQVPWRTLGVAVAASAVAAGAWFLIVPARIASLSDLVGVVFGGLLGLILYGGIVAWSGEASLPHSVIQRIEQSRLRGLRSLGGVVRS